jgi:hypothetical protein
MKAALRYAFAMRAIKLSLVLAVAALVVPAILFTQQNATLPATSRPAASENDALILLANSHAPMKLKAADLKGMPHVTVTIHNPHANADESYSGVLLVELLAKVDAPLGEKLRGKALSEYVVATGADGYKTVIALAEADPSFHPGDILVADSMNGALLDVKSGPFRLVVSEDKRPARSVRNLISLELKQAE